MRAVCCNAPARSHVVGQATARSLLEQFTLQALLERHPTNGYASIIVHVLRIFMSHLGWGGVGNGNAVERGSGWWVDAPEHCACAVFYACSYVLVALICVIVNFYSGF